MITKDEFMAGYAGRGGRTTQDLLDQGMVAIECHACDYDACEGWQMTTLEVIKMYKELGMRMPNA